MISKLLLSINTTVKSRSSITPLLGVNSFNSSTSNSSNRSRKK